jgi:hypothetical protein
MKSHSYICRSSVIRPLVVIVALLSVGTRLPVDMSSAQEPLTREADVTPCGNIESSKTLRVLEKNVVVFLDYDEETVAAAHVRLTCEYHEPGLRKKGGHVLMSSRTYSRLLKKLGRLRSFGQFREDEGVNAVYSPIVAKTHRYSQATVVSYEYSCTRSNLGCGVTKFDVYYHREGK